jgi:hypothetical protein
MLNRDKLNKLYALATGKQPQEEQKKAVVNELNEKKKKKLVQDLHKYRGMYEDPYKAWTNWYRDSSKNISSDIADDVWSEAEKEFPGSPDQAKQWMRDEMQASVESVDPSAREIAMRNKLSQAPSWLGQEMLPQLQSTSATVSNQNLTKAKSAYKRVLDQKISKLDLTQLDPEVPVEQHVMDAIKAEMLGLLEATKIINGRFTAINPDGQPQPLFSIQDDATMAGPEQQYITELAEPLFTKYIQSAMSENTEMLQLDNRAATGATLQQLKSGDLDISEWQSAIGLIGDSDGAIEAGIQGLVKKNPYMDQEELLSSALDINNIKRGY